MNAPEPRADFVRRRIQEDLESGKNEGRLQTRFPPEPNGYLHIGHAKAICLNFGVAEEFGGKCNLRFDDTNPVKEDDEFVQSIKEDLRWLGFSWEEREFFASDYFERLYEHACALIRKGKAYVDSLSAEEIREHRGTLTEPGTPSPYRERSVEENLDLFARMKAGEFEDGAHVLRAKIDMASPNINLRDPTIYRIRRAHHHRTGDAWCVYPMYDWAHGLSDSYEGITHSLCSLEFEDHRPLYEWFLNTLEVYCPQQIEFARLRLNYTVLSKRKLRRLVEEGHVSGWDDPRMPTLSGLRRRGYPAEAIRAFCKDVGVAKFNSTIDVARLELAVRDQLNRSAPRVLGVLRPLKVVLTNYPEGESETFEAVNNPEDASAGVRQVPFGRELYIERDDFREDPPKKFFRLAPGQEVRLRYACVIKCEEVIKDASGEVVELRCTWDPESRGGCTTDGRKVKGTIHWVSAAHAIRAEVRLYDRLFSEEDPEAHELSEALNRDSLETLPEALLEPYVADAKPGDVLQFERLGYFCADRESTPEALVFNRTVTLRDSWAKIEKKEQAKGKGKKAKGQPKAKAEPKAKKAKPSLEPKDVLGFEEFTALDLRVAKVVDAQAVPKADKLLQLTLELKDGEQRTVLSGIRATYAPEALVGRQVVYLANLAPRKIFGVESQGMVLAATDPDGQAILLEPDRLAPDGSKVT